MLHHEGYSSHCFEMLEPSVMPCVCCRVCSTIDTSSCRFKSADQRLLVPGRLGPRAEHGLPPCFELALAHLHPALGGRPLCVHVLCQGFDLQNEPPLRV